MSSDKEEITVSLDLTVKLIEQKLIGTDAMRSIDILAEFQGRTRLDIITEFVQKEIARNA